MKLAIPVDTLKALMLFTAKDDIRFYLNGIHIETGPNRTLAVATNGHVMALANLDMVGSKPATILVPRDGLERALKAVTKTTVCLDIEFDPGDDPGRTISIEVNDTVIRCVSIDDRYPDFRRVFPHKVSGESAQYNPDYLALLTKANKLLGHKDASYPGIAMNGNSCGLSVIREDFVAVVMPLRVEPAVETPAWVHARAEEPAEAEVV